MGEKNAYHLNVSWEFAITLAGMALGTPFGLVFFIHDDSGPPTKRGELIFLCSVTGFFYGLALIGILVRIWKAGRGLQYPESSQARWHVFNQIGLGLAIAMLGIVAGIYSYNLAKPRYFYVIPTGIILFGLSIMGEAMGCSYS